MECPEIKRHLSEYIDGVLDAEKAAQVEEHLKSCADCRAELHALERLIQALGSMDALEAPGGFMEGVHQRIERGSWLSRISRSLFVPFRVKIPIQAASLVTACLLVFLIYHNMRTAEEVTSLMQKQRIRVAAEKAMPATPPPAKAKKVSRLRSRLMKADSIPEKKALKPFQLVLLVSKGSRSVSTRQKMSGPAAEERLAQVAGKRKESSLDEVSGANAPKEVMAGKAFSREEDLAEKLLNRLTRETNGRVLHTQNDKATGRAVQFSVEIPARHLDAFLEKLSKIGSLETHAPIAPHVTEKMVRLDIRLLYEQ